MLSIQNQITSAIKPLLGSSLRPSITSITVRYFGPKSYPHVDGTYRGQAPIRYGHEPHHHTKGLLPRLKIKEARLPTMPVSAKEDEWSRRQARMGENDFIKIMGEDSDVQQHELLTHIPDWLRGYRANTEYSVLMRKRKEFDYWRYTKPLKWKHLDFRIKYLYKRINNKYAPPKIELLKRSRYV